MINCFLVTDKETMKLLIGYASALSIRLVGCSSSLSEGINEIMFIKPDIIYMDILCLKHNPTEFNLLKQISFFVLLSNNKNDAYNAYEFQALDYMLKPIDYFRFMKGIERFRRSRALFSERSSVTPSASLSDFFFIKTDNKGLKEVMIKYYDLIFVQAMQNYVLLHITGGKIYTCHISMRDIEQYLPSALFSRVHKSFIINDSKIAFIEGYMINLKSEALIGITPLTNSNKNAHGSSITVKKQIFGDENYIIQIGSTYRKYFFDKIGKRMISGNKKKVS